MSTLLEFEDNWQLPTETKAPDKPVRVAPPVDKTIIQDEEHEQDNGSTQTPVTEAAADNNDVAKTETKLSAGLSAELTSMGIDTVQGIVFMLINNRKIVRRIGRENIDRFGDLLEQLKNGEKILDKLSDEDKLLFWKFRRLKQIEEDIPFTNEEYNRLNEVLEKFYQETGKSMPAWMGLAIALTQVLGGRLSDAMTE